MSLLNRLRPKWQNTDPDVRADAVRELDKTEVELLTAVAQQDTDARVRKIAIKKLDAPRLLLEIAENDSDDSLRSYARQRARQLLIQIACDERDLAESTRALGLLSSASDIASVAEKAHFEEVRSTAFDSLTGDEALFELVRHGKDPELRARAFARIVEPESLKNIVLDESSSDLALSALARLEDLESLQAIVDHGNVAKAVRRQALAKLSTMVPDDHPIKVKEREQLFSELCQKAETLAEGADLSATEGLAALSVEWSELESRGVPDEKLVARFNDARERIEARAKKLAGPIQEATPSEPLPQPPPPPRHDNSREELTTLLESASDEKLTETLDDVRTRWDRLTSKVDDALAKRFDAAVEKAEQRLERSQVEEREQEIDIFLKSVEAAVALEKLADAVRSWQKHSKRWHALEVAADIDAKARYARAESNLKERQEKDLVARDRREQATLTEIQAHLKKMAELSEAKEVSIREADKELRVVQDLLKTMGPLSRSVNRKKVRRELVEAREKLFKKRQEARDIEDWKRWANVDIQGGLITRMEALRDVKDIPKVAKDLRAIHEDWKKAGAAPAEKADELWQRYKAIRDELKARCDEFFHRQNEERAENLIKKEALCEQVEALQDSEDWNKTADAIKEAQAQWKKIGPAPQKKSDAIWKRFRKACDHFFDRRKGHFGDIKSERDENLKKKAALCEQAEAIQESTDWRNTVDALKNLQAEWRTIGPVPQKKSDQVWKRFRKACDYFFDRYKRRDEVEAEERVKHREALVEQAAELASKEGPSQPTEPAELAGKVKELWSNWKGLGALPDSKRELQERFEKLVAELVSGAPTAFENTDLDPAISRKKREKLVSRLESLVNEFRVANQPAQEIDQLEDLAARLKDALASNTMTGGKAPDRKLDWRSASEEVRRLRANWLRAAPVPGDEGKVLGERFQNAYRDFFENKPRANG